MKILILIFAFEIKESKITRGHNYTLVKKQSRLDVRKYSFSQRTINVWNKLSTDWVHASSVNMYDQSWPPTIDRTINQGILHEQSIGGATGRKVARPVAGLIVRPLTIWNSRFQVLNITIDLVDLPLAITHDLCDQSYDICDQSYVLSSICPRLQHFRSQVSRNLVVSPI